MSGVWMFKPNGVIRVEENLEESREESSSGPTKVLVYVGTNEIITSYAKLDNILTKLGWKRYYEGDPNNFIQFQNPSSSDLITLPKDFSKFKTLHMYDIVSKNPGTFHVKEA